MKASEKLERILIGGGRGSGRTEAILKGAENQPNCVVVCANHAHENHIKSRAPNVKTLSLQETEKLIGMHQPLVLEHFALEVLWNEIKKEHETQRRSKHKEYLLRRRAEIDRELNDLNVKGDSNS